MFFKMVWTPWEYGAGLICLCVYAGLFPRVRPKDGVIKWQLKSKRKKEKAASITSPQQRHNYLARLRCLTNQRLNLNLQIWGLFQDHMSYNEKKKERNANYFCLKACSYSKSHMKNPAASHWQITSIIVWVFWIINFKCFILENQ